MKVSENEKNVCSISVKLIERLIRRFEITLIIHD